MLFLGWGGSRGEWARVSWTSLEGMLPRVVRLPTPVTSVPPRSPACTATRSTSSRRPDRILSPQDDASHRVLGHVVQGREVAASLMPGGNGTNSVRVC